MNTNGGVLRRKVTWPVLEGLQVWRKHACRSVQALRLVQRLRRVLQGNMTTACSSTVNPRWFRCSGQFRTYNNPLTSWVIGQCAAPPEENLSGSLLWGALSCMKRKKAAGPCTSSTKNVSYSIYALPSYTLVLRDVLWVTQTSFPSLALRSDSRVRITEGLPYIEMQIENDFTLCKAPNNNARML